MKVFDLFLKMSATIVVIVSVIWGRERRPSVSAPDSSIMGLGTSVSLVLAPESSKTGLRHDRERIRRGLKTDQVREDQAETEHGF